jgi:hypothetical protein
MGSVLGRVRAAAERVIREGNKIPRDEELRPVSERLGMSYRGVRASHDADYAPPLDPATLSKHSPMSTTLMQGYRNGRWAMIFDCTSQKDPGSVTLKWLLNESDDIQRYVFHYTCAAVKSDAPLPDCALLRKNMRSSLFGLSRYGLSSTRELEAADEWIVATNGSLMEPSVAAPELAEWLPSVSPGWHFRLRHQWFVCIAGGEEPDDLPVYRWIEPLKTVEAFAQRADALIAAL